jgi:hypothetical protein
MDHPIYKVRSFRHHAAYTLSVRFNDHTERVIDFSPVLRGELFGPLLDEKLFNRVKIDRESHNLLWPNGADFDPADLHDWPEAVDAFTSATRRWRPKPLHTKSPNKSFQWTGPAPARR